MALQFGAERAGGGEDVTRQACSLRRCHILLPIVDEQPLAGRKVESVEREREDRRVGLYQPLLARDDDRIEQIEQGRLTCADRRPEFGGEIGDGEERHATRREFADKIGHAGHERRDRLPEARPERLDQRAMLRVTRDQLCARLREGTAGVMLEMPVMRDDPRQKIFQRGRIGNQLLVKVARVPFDKDIADVENKGARPRNAAQP